MRIVSEVKQGFVEFWECHDDYTPDVEVMFDFCEGFGKSKSYLIDEVIRDLEEVGSTKAKSWLLSNDSREKVMQLKVVFKNGFYICFGVPWIEGRVY